LEESSSKSGVAEDEGIKLAASVESPTSLEVDFSASFASSFMPARLLL